MNKDTAREPDPGLDGDEINTSLQGMDFSRSPTLTRSIRGTFTGKDGVKRDLQDMPTLFDVMNEMAKKDAYPVILEEAMRSAAADKVILSVPAGIGKAFSYYTHVDRIHSAPGADYDGNTALWPTTVRRIKRRFGNAHAIHRSRTMRTKR